MGLLVAFEGIDGSGKGTQAALLVERLKQSDVSAVLVSFPRYGATFFGRAVGEFLNGGFGGLGEVHPFLVSLLFAGDRFESQPMLAAAIVDHDVVVLDRYVPSNIAHQAAKLQGQKRDGLIKSIEEIEYTIFGMPRPDLVILLDLGVAAAQQLIARKPGRSYTDRAADIQEADADYLACVRDLYLAMAQGNPAWATVCCEREGTIAPIQEIASEIWRLVSARRAEGASGEAN